MEDGAELSSPSLIASGAECYARRRRNSASTMSRAAGRRPASRSAGRPRAGPAGPRGRTAAQEMWIGEAPLPEVGDDVGEPLRNEAAVVGEQRALELCEHGEVLWDVLGQGVPRQELVLEPVHGVEHPEDHARWVERAVDVLRCVARTTTAPSSALTFQTSCSSGRSCSDDRATPRRALTAAPRGPRRRQRPARH
jgi:hypothetical protein